MGPTIPMLRAGHTRPQIPQLFTSAVRLTQAPLQRVEPAGHPAHMPMVHCMPSKHRFAHRPQDAILVKRLVSQPVAGAPSQSPKFALHVVPHRPAVHVGVWFAPAGHRVPQTPQLFTSVVVFTQLPAPHCTSGAQPFAHIPLAHIPCGALHTLRQLPQFSAPCSEASQPFMGFWSQSP